MTDPASTVDVTRTARPSATLPCPGSPLLPEVPANAPGDLSPSRVTFPGEAPERGPGAATKASRREGDPADAPVDTGPRSSRRFEEIPIGLIDPDPDQVRRRIDVETDQFLGLCANVAHHGVLQPVLVRPGTTPGRYTLIAGEYRYTAAKKAGHAVIPCCIEQVPLEQNEIVLRQLSENLHRTDLSHIELARAFAWLTRPLAEGGGGLTARELARRLGKSESFVSEHKRLLELSPEDQHKLETGAISFDQARARLRKNARRTIRARNGSSLPTAGHHEPAAHATAEPIPRRLDNGYEVHREFSRRYPDTGLLVLLASPEAHTLGLETIIPALERHLHFLKLKHARSTERRDPARSPAT